MHIETTIGLSMREIKKIWLDVELAFFINSIKYSYEKNAKRVAET